MLVWLGPFFIDPSMPSQRSLLASMASLTSLNRRPFSPTGFPDAETFRHQRLVTFAAGDLPALSISRLYLNGRPVRQRRSFQSRETFALDFAQQQSFRLTELGLPGRDHEPGHEHLNDFLLTGTFPPMAQTACVGLARGQDPLGVIVPVNEVLRWCYGSSSRMLQAVLSGTLENILDTIQAQAVTSGTTYELTLPPGFVPADAQTLAWLATDAHARAAALYIDRSVMANKGQVGTHPELSFPAVTFPYQRPQTLELLGRWIPSPEPGRPRRFLVSRILSSDFRSGVQATLCRLEAAQADPAEAPADPQLRSPAPRAAADAVLHSDAERLRDAVPVRLRALPSQFSQSLPLQRLEITPPAAPSLAQGPAARPHDLTTSPGTDPYSVARAATLTSQAKSQEQDLDDPPAPRVGFPTDFQDLRLALRRITTVSFRELPIDAAETRGNIDCLVVECRLNNVFCYLFERNRTTAQAGAALSLLLTRAPAGQQLTRDNVAAFLTAQVRHRGWILPAETWRRVRFPHSFRDAETLAAGLLRELESLSGDSVFAAASDRPVDHQHPHLPPTDQSP